MVERFFKQRIRQQLDIDHMQFGFMKGKGTTDTIFIVKQMQEKFTAKGKKLYFGFIDFEKAFDGVPREVIRWQRVSWELKNGKYWQTCLCIQVQKQL